MSIISSIKKKNNPSSMGYISSALHMTNDELQTYEKPLREFESEREKRNRLPKSLGKRTITFLNGRNFYRSISKYGTKTLESKLNQIDMRKKPNVLMEDMRTMLDVERTGIDMISVLNETADVLKEATLSTDIRVYMVDDARDEIYQISHNYVNDLYRISYKIRLNSTVAAYVAYTKEFIKVDDLLEDARFPLGLGCSEITIKAVLCVPVMTPENECVAVFEMSSDLEDRIYEDRDLRLAIVLCGWIGSTIFQNTQRVTLQKQHELNNYLFDLTKTYFANSIAFDKLVTNIINFAKISLSAEHGLFFVLKTKNGETFADFYEEGIGADKDTLFKKNTKIHLDNNNTTDLVSLVAHKGITINVRNAYKDNRIKQDKKKGYIIRSVLCMPIRGIDEVLGVVQVINKKDGNCFTKADEILFQTFTVYCSFVLSYARMNNKMIKKSNLNVVYKEMLLHHMQPCPNDLNYFIEHNDDEAVLPLRFNYFDWYVNEKTEPYMPQLVRYMFQQISREMFTSIQEITQFILTIQKSYFNNPYHNFHHGFNVLHSMFCMVSRNSELFTDVERMAMVIATYCHDVGHLGVTNNFLDITNHPLAQLYEESIFENHHIYITLLVFDQLQLFKHFPESMYKAFVTEIRELILATDLATYFKQRSKLYNLCAENRFDYEDQTHKRLLKNTMMTMADLSGMCKPFNVARVIIDNVYQEFYKEGDLEKEMGMVPLSIMDREKRNMVPADQFQFMTVVVLPCALVTTKLLPNCSQLYKEALKLRETWQEIYESQGQKLWNAENSIAVKGKYF